MKAELVHLALLMLSVCGVFGLLSGGVALHPRLVTRFPRAVLLALGACSVVALFFVVQPNPLAFRIALDPSTEPLLPLDDPGREFYERTVLNFGSDDLYIVVMKCEDVFTLENLEALRGISRDIRRLPGVRHTESLVDALSFRYVAEEDWVEVGQLIDELPTTPADMRELRHRVLGDPFYVRSIVSSDGRSAAINVSFEDLDDSELIERDLDGAIRNILAAHAIPEREFFVTGRPHLRAVAHHLMIRDLLRLIPLAALVAAAALWLLTGSWIEVLIPLGNCLLATLWAFAAMGAAGVDLNVISLVLAPTLISVGSVYGVHFVARHRHFAETTRDRREAALRTLEYSRAPVLMAGLTTCVGFAALLLSDVRATAELGCFAVIGIASVTLLTLTGAPATLALLPLPPRPESGKAPGNRISHWIEGSLSRLLDRIGALAAHRPAVILSIWLAITAAAALAIPQIEVDTDFLNFFDEQSRVRRDFNSVNTSLVGAIPIYIAFEGPLEGAFREPQAMRDLDQIRTQLESVDGVERVLTGVDLIRRANRAMEGDHPDAERIPDTREGLSELIFMVPKRELRRFTTSNQNSANLVVRTDRVGSAAIRSLEERIRDVLARNPLPAGLEGRVTGNTVLINRSADGIAANQLTQVGLAALVIFALVWITFRSLPVAMVSMIPNIAPVLIFFGCLGAGAATLSLPTGLIGCIALGIAIDDTLHFLVAYRRKRELGLDSTDAVRDCIRQVGRPIAITSIMLICGFSTLQLSSFATLREFGSLTALTMAICLSTDLGLLPALLVKVRDGGGGAAAKP